MKTLEKSTRSRINLKESEIAFCLNSKIYPKEIVFKACYTLIDKIYIYIDVPSKDTLSLSLKSKKKLTQKKLEDLRNEFLNELLNAIVRKNVSQKNQKIVECIVGGAINAALTRSGRTQDSVGNHNQKIDDDEEDIKRIEEEIEALKKELEAETEKSYQDDPLNIKKTA